MRISAIVMLFLLIPAASAEIMVHAGYPQLQPNSIANAITVGDINNDGVPDIIAAPHSKSVKVYDINGNLLWKAIAGMETASNTVSPLAADVNGDDNIEILLAGGTPGDQTYMHSIYIWNSGGTLLKSYDLGNGYAPSTPAFANGLILVGISGSFTGMNAYDMTGLKWQLPFSGGSERMNGIAVGDLDGDGSYEAVLAGGGRVTAVNAAASGGSVRWQKDVPDPISPVIINVSGKKIVVASGSSGTFAWDEAGNPVWSSAVAAKYYFNSYSSPAFSDLNNDGSDDVMIARDYDVHAISGMDGTILFKASAATSPPGSFRARPAIYDINKDSKPEIITGDSNGNLYIWDPTGKLLDGFPVRITDRLKPMHSSPAVYDLEGDGVPEVVIGSATDLLVVSVKTKSMDATPPVTTDNADDAWHNSSVTITLTARDEESGIAATYYTVDGSEPTKDSARGTTITLSGDGIYTTKYFSVDSAGNTEPVKTAVNQVKIDKTPPSTSDNADGEWHNGSVAVTLTPRDDGSGIAATYYAVDGSEQATGTAIAVSGDGIHTLKYYSVDNAGNKEGTKEAIVRIDGTPPVTTDDSDNQWHNADVALTIVSSDSISGIAFINYKVDGVEQASSSPNIRLAFTEEGVHEVEYYAVDNAGNAEEAKTAVVKIDKTSPVTLDDSDGQWHNGSVTVKLTASDNLAGVQSTGYKVNSDTESVMESFFAWLYNAVGLEESASLGDTVSLPDEGVFSIRYSSLDNAGNIELEKTSKQVKIDKTPPVITVNSPQNKTYLHSDIIALSFAAQDTLSGIKTMSSAIDGAVQVSDGQAFDMLGLGFGAHEFYISVGDNAGNLNSKKVSFDVIATIDSLSALTERGSASGGAAIAGGGSGVWITSNGVANSLRAKLNSARAKIDAGQNTAAKNILEAYVNEVEAQTNKGITSEGAGILRAEAKYVIEHL